MNSKKNKYFGLLIMAWGFLFLAKNYMLPSQAKQVIFSFPMLVLNVGLLILIFKKYKALGVGVCATGIMLFGVEFLGLEIEIKKMFFPLLLIVVGAITYLSATRLRKEKSKNHKEAKTTQDFVDDKSRSVDVVFGSTLVDLTHHDFSKFEFELEAFCLFGEVKVIIPKHIDVDKKKCSVLFGSIEGKHVIVEPKIENNNHSLILKGTVVMGAIKIHYV